MRLQSTVTALLATALAATATVAPAISPAEGADGSQALVRPEKDPFYKYDGDKPLRDIKPGTPLKTRDVTLGADTNQTPLPAEQILYRTTDTTGRAVATVTTVVLPATGTTQPRVAAYLSFYDALSAKCNPSYTLRGGNPGAANQELTDLEQGAVQSLAQQGYVVTVPDFENQDLHWVAGRESGKSALDGITATLKALELGKATPVGMMGYSGGSIAADWASELQPHRAPWMNLVGTAMGGVPVDLRHNLPYVDGTPEWSDVIPGAMIGISRANRLDLMPYLSKWGRMVARTEVTPVHRRDVGRVPEPHHQAPDEEALRGHPPRAGLPPDHEEARHGLGEGPPERADADGLGQPRRQGRRRDDREGPGEAGCGVLQPGRARADPRDPGRRPQRRRSDLHRRGRGVAGAALRRRARAEHLLSSRPQAQSSIWRPSWSTT